MRDESILDYFYVHERLRRWRMAGESDGIASPLLAPGFQSAARSLTPAERMDAVLHRRIIDKLVPQWRHFDFFHGDPARPPALIRAGRATDREVVEALFATAADEWAAFFVPGRVSAAWHASTHDHSSNTKKSFCDD